MNSYGWRYLYLEGKSFDLCSEGKKTEGLRITENGRGFRRSIFLDKEEFAWFLDALDDFWWKCRPVTWAKHLVKRNYELWFSYDSNRRGEYLTLTVQGDRRVKTIFFPGGLQGKRWWKLFVAAYELPDKPVKPSKDSEAGESKKSERPNEKVGQMIFPWKTSVHYPHCNILINANMAMEFEGKKTYPAAVYAVEGSAIRVGQRQSESCRVDPNSHYGPQIGCTVSVSNDNPKRRFGKRGDKGKTLVVLGRSHADKKDGSGEKKRYSWREKGKWKMKNDVSRGLSVCLDPNGAVYPTRGGI